MLAEEIEARYPGALGRLSRHAAIGFVLARCRGPVCYYRGDVLRIPPPSYGHYSDAGCVNYLDERGSHAGPSEDELYTFVAAPPRVAFDFRAVTRARDLHPLFARYRAGSPDSVRPRAESQQGTAGG